MNKIGQAVKDIHISDNAGYFPNAKNAVHPLSRVLVTFLYLLLVVSFPSYDLIGLAGMVLYLLIHILWYEISVGTMVKRIWPVILLTGLVGIASPVMNREVCVMLGEVAITYGMLSMITLMVKGIFCVTASYILAVTAGIEQICYSLRILHIPKEIVTVIMLMHRYLIVLLKELERMLQAYRMRAPNQKGLQFRAWSSFVGLLLLRSMDRAEEVYESMKLRGFQGEMKSSSWKSNKASVFYALLWGITFLLLRSFPIFRMVGSFLAASGLL